MTVISKRIFQLAFLGMSFFAARLDAAAITDFVNFSLVDGVGTTEFATGGHAIWDRVYSTPSVYNCLFAQTTAVPEPTFLFPFFVLAVLGRARSRCAHHG